ncbi:MAG: hypothetical protein EBX92_05495 [Actinobacteria bacterium]|nr:hypothetical protein [Actinomycetota bacterium]
MSRKQRFLRSISFRRIGIASALAIAALTLSACANSNSTTADEANSAGDQPLGYRYWGYSQSSTDGSSWVTAMEGPATTKPSDGSVEGWNYTISAEGVVDPTPPKTLPDFTSLCAQTAEESGKKRVGFVIEFGDSAIHPEGELAPNPSSGCVVVPENGTGLDVLNVAAKVRAGDGGFICGLNGFPSEDCGADPIPVPQSMRKK